MLENNLYENKEKECKILKLVFTMRVRKVNIIPIKIQRSRAQINQLPILLVFF